ncbi:MAG: DUF4062 domain-containing protein [Lentimicrobium sp.]
MGLKNYRPSIFLSANLYGYESQLLQIVAILDSFGFKVLSSFYGSIPINPKKTNQDNLIDAVKECDIFLGILSPYYGYKIPSEGKSITHLQFETALLNGKLCYFLVDNSVILAKKILNRFEVSPDRADSKSKRPLVDFAVIELYDFISLNGQPDLLKAGNWIQPFNNFYDILAFIQNQFENPNIFENIVKKYNRNSLVGFITKKQVRKIQSPLVFISYSRQDNNSELFNEKWITRFLEHASSFASRENIKIYSDQDISIGEKWEEEIISNLLIARFVVLFISSSFLCSDFIRNRELPIILDKADKKELTIISIIVRPCAIKHTIFKYPDPKYGPKESYLSKYQAVNDIDKTLMDLKTSDQDRVLMKAAQKLAGL